MDYNQVIAEYEAEIAVLDHKLSTLKTGRQDVNAYIMQLICMRGDLHQQLHEARAAASRGRPPDRGND